MYTSDSDLVLTESSEMNDRLEQNTCDADKENAPSPTNDDNKNCSRYTKRRLAEEDSNQETKRKPELRRV